MTDILDEARERRERWNLRAVGYAPGSYCCTCHTCGSVFSGDKRALRCRPCAENLAKEISHD